MTPEWGTPGVALPPETQFLLLELSAGGPYALVLPLIDGTFRGTLRPGSPLGSGSAELTLRMESGSDTVFGDDWPSALYLGALAWVARGLTTMHGDPAG